ncbi:clostripain-related cysteine peptidase [Ruminococcus sp. FC2018]|uniref:clostripain-related cysteine peptidase n=1 Tax=Ruminococcus sp. FC2018 TaxID=1410617 RepID=UPI00048C7537|nr:clostripain-related cysteine peptidase [Ruminococcus sp. FC2018]
MKNRMIAISLAVLFALLCFGCDKNEQSETENPGTSASTSSVSDAGSKNDTQPANDAQAVENVLFVYMCGSDLETRLGLGGKSIDEMLSVNLGDKLTIVIETGGAKKWRSHDIRSDKLQRWEISGGKLKLLETLDDNSMGDQQTLTDFLSWGNKKYRSTRRSLVLWNHGGGCMGGVCSDENHVGDSLRIDEVKGALESAKPQSKYEIIGFDACLMASVETAAKVKDYAQFMAASEESEPGGGWDYKAFIQALANEPLKNVGKTICDSFMEKSKANGKGSKATMSVFDLSKTDELISEFDAFAASLNSALKQGGKEKISSAAAVSEKFGEDDTNLVDLGDLVSKTDFYDSTKMDRLLTQFVVCTVSSGRSNKGVSFWFPVSCDDKDIKNYGYISISAMYLQFLNAYRNK